MLNKIKNLTKNELIENNKVFTIMRDGYSLGRLILKSGSFYYIDNEHTSIKCDYREIRLNTDDLEKAVELISY